MKVVFILPDLGAGGAERVVSILSGAMRKRGFLVDIVLFLGDRVRYQIPDGVELVRLGGMEMTRAQRLRTLRDYFRKQKQTHKAITAIPFHDSCLLYTLASCAGFGIPVIACERNDPYQKGSRGVSRLKARLPYLLASRCVFQTPDARDYYGMGVRGKSRVIVNPLVLPEEIRWKGAQSISILSVGRLEPQKNQKILIDAFARLHKEFPMYFLEIYGEGALRSQLQEQIRQLGLEDSVFLRGYAPDIHQKLTQAVMFVLPSDYEGMSNALIEALAIGVPTVTTDHPIGGARMLVEDGVNGLMTPVGDADALYRAMKRILCDPALAHRLGEAGVLVRQRLDVDAVTEQWMELLGT